ncbi:Putative undecaprenyl-phosphate N-acetylgalactosaminyl 1-phosphate transferase [Pseudooceanicola marinus]|uniref:Putative undecaprenyl-phosphate N-acetylgalactosaminyl 1-phosphate transferase n=1 Tax=Pseudooceanicola marinus TaxID=396013 RepID=A0A1X7A4N3_9RHOB|nr:sugar transferase [Pseudooceanicola marinus]PJE27131.1 sugar transferase [Pseudooceanicola marinus]SLN70167.1 Putative undecaprenyl-phosphate N-acetylgalactosaminyl 1-phosphate transferase [Pseudooceanicola marinus]
MFADYVTMLLAAIGAVLLAAASRILADDIKVFVPKICVKLIRRAAAGVSEDHSAALEEEWLSHLDDIPEITGKAWHALSLFFFGAPKISREVGRSSAASSKYARQKRVFDLAFAAFFLPGILPVILTIWVLLTLREDGSSFVRVRVVGKNGRPFYARKFRTVHEDCEGRLAAYLSSNPLEMNRYLCGVPLENDPRVTKIGQFLRVTALDELPWIFSLLKGDMSVVGPRPVSACDIEKSHRAQSAFAPGLFGTWALAAMGAQGSSGLGSPDEEYSKKASFITDLKIIYALFRAVMRQSR